MKILCPIKRVIDFNINITIKSDKSGVVEDGVKMSINPFDEIAVEEALRIKEQGHCCEVIIVSVGSTKCQEQIRQALAMGADRGILVETNKETEPLHVAKILHKIMQDNDIGLTILGKQAIDDDCNQTGQMLGAIANLPFASFASKVEFVDKDLHVTREIDGGLQTIKLSTPSIITTDLRLNEPRYASLPNIMKAKKKPIDIIPLDSLNINYNNRFETLSVSEQPKRVGGGKVTDIDQLIKELKNAGI